MVRNMGIAADLGYLNVPDGVLVDVKQIDDLPDDQVVLMCTGSQGEPMAALSRMANNDHKVAVGHGDTVVLASSLIPGNENAVYRVINGLTRLGARRRAPGQRQGARLRPRQRRRAPLLLQHPQARATSCRCTARSGTCVANAALAVHTGVPPERVVLVEDGVVVDLVDGVRQGRRRRAVRLRLRRRLVGRRDHRAPTSRTAASSATRASSRSSS